METMIKAYEIGKNAGLKYVYLGNVAMPAVTYCPKCNEELIVRTVFKVEKNILKTDKKGTARCPKCGEKIEGVWQ
jgi:pyruvate formate lyase activating enzyme